MPSQTRTVIETNTATGSVIAVAAGGHIATGSAQSESYSSQKIAAVPVAGVVGQASDVKVGELRRDADNIKVGDAAIVNTMTTVNQAQQVQQQPIMTTQQPIMTTQTQQPILGGNTTTASSGLMQKEQHTSSIGSKHVDASYGSKVNPLTGRSEPTSTDATRRL